MIPDNSENLEEIAKCFNELFDEGLSKEIPIVIAVNSKGNGQQLSQLEVEEKMRLSVVLSRQPCCVFLTCAIEGTGLYEVLDWISNRIIP